MKRSAIEIAQYEAKKFIILAENVLGKDDGLYLGYCKETSALRRKSMDLTRALSEMRKP